MASTIQLNSISQKKKEGIAKAASRIKPVHEVNKWGKFVFYGRNKSGKTHLAVSSGLKTLIVDCEEKGSETVVGLKEYAPNVFVYELSRWEELDWIYWYLKAGEHDFEVIVIDTITMLSTLGLKWVLGEERQQDTLLDPMMPDPRHYGKLNMALGQVIINWRNLPAHVVFLAQERRDMIEDDANEDAAAIIEIVPSLTKGPRGTLMSAVGTIGRLYTKDVTKMVKGKEVTTTERRMLVAPHEKYAAGTRIQGLPRILRNPTLKMLLDHRAQHGETVPDTN